MTPAPVALAGAAALVVVAAAFDLKARRVPNALVVVGSAAGLLHGALQLGPAAGLAAGLGGLALGGALLLGPFLLGGSGGGDVKLLAALGAWLGPQALLGAFLWIALLAAALAAAVMAGTGTFAHLCRVPEDALLLWSGGERPAPRPGPGLPFAAVAALGFAGWALSGATPLGALP